jgi:hypothetical protein
MSSLGRKVIGSVALVFLLITTMQLLTPVAEAQYPDCYTWCNTECVAKCGSIPNCDYDYCAECCIDWLDDQQPWPPPGACVKCKNK